MTQRMHRSQILLLPKQHRALAEIAKREDRSISDIVRDIVGRYLEEDSQAARLQRELEALEALGRIREQAEQRYGIYQGDLLADVRDERQRQISSAQNQEQ